LNRNDVPGSRDEASTPNSVTMVRPRSRTLTTVHDGILEDVVYPAEIVGKRVRYHLDGAKVMKVCY